MPDPLIAAIAGKTELALLARLANRHGLSASATPPPFDRRAR